MMVRHTWYKFESSSFVQAQISLLIHLEYMCASIGMMH